MTERTSPEPIGANPAPAPPPAWADFPTGTLADLVRAHAPAGTAAVIIAELTEDDSDPMTDYFASRTVSPTIIIGWRSGSREDFRALRRAAASWAPTAHLDARECEQRENWSMGRGNYLASGKWAGWRVRSWSVGAVGKHFGNYRAVIAPCALAQSTPAGERAAAPVSGVTVSLNRERAGVEIRFPSKPAPAVLDALKAAGWRWSRFGSCWYKRQGPGVLVEAWELTGSGPAAEVAPEPADVEAEPAPEIPPAPVEAAPGAPAEPAPAGEDRPIPGAVYRLTGTSDQPSVGRGDPLSACRVEGAEVIPFRRRN